MSKTFVFSDLHLPFVNKRAYAAAMKQLRLEKPDHVVQIGDILDQYIFSRYSKDTKVRDMDSGLKMARQFWQDVKKAAPRAKCYQLLGNHDVRLSKRIAEQLPELFDIYNPLEMYNFPGVKVCESDRDYLTINGVVYTHGWLSKSLDHANYFGRPTVHGHRHRPCIETKGKLWSMDIGFMADETSLPLSYTMNKFSQWRMACGVVEDGKPRLILL